MLNPEIPKTIFLKKSLESGYPLPEDVALRLIRGFATEILTAFYQAESKTLTTPKGIGFHFASKSSLIEHQRGRAAIESQLPHQGPLPGRERDHVREGIQGYRNGPGLTSTQKT